MTTAVNKVRSSLPREARVVLASTSDGRVKLEVVVYMSGFKKTTYFDVITPEGGTTSRWLDDAIEDYCKAAGLTDD